MLSNFPFHPRMGERIYLSIGTRSRHRSTLFSKRFYSLDQSRSPRAARLVNELRPQRWRQLQLFHDWNSLERGRTRGNRKWTQREERGPREEVHTSTLAATTAEAALRTCACCSSTGGSSLSVALTSTLGGPYLPPGLYSHSHSHSHRWRHDVANIVTARAPCLCGSLYLHIRHAISYLLLWLQGQLTGSLPSRCTPRSDPAASPPSLWYTKNESATVT